MNRTPRLRDCLGPACVSLVLVGLSLTSLYSYVLFHSLAEVFSIVVAGTIYSLTWYSRRWLDNHAILLLGISSLFVGGVDLIHTLAYKGMGVFPGDNANLATQLWIAARSLQSVAFLLAPLYVTRRFKPHAGVLVCGVATAFLLGSIFWGVFPDCYVEGVGLTPFKKVSEYVISLVLAASLVFLVRKRSAFEQDVLRWLVLSIALTIGGELAFTAYVSVYGLSNLVGHLFKILAFYLLYKAIVETGLARPYDLLFRELKQSEEALREARDTLERRVADRTGELATANAQLMREVAERQQAEDALRRAGAYNRSLIEASLDPLVTIGPDGKITDVNAATERATGCRRAELIGTDFSDYFTDPGKARLGYQQVFRDGSIRDYALEILHRDGHVTSVLYSASVYSDEGGEVIGVFAAARDITERKRAEEEVRRLNEGLEQRVAERTVQLRRTNQQLEKEIAERRQAEETLRETRDYLEELFNHATAPIIVWDREFRIVRFNHAFEHLTGYLAEEVMGKALEILFPEASREVSLREIDRTSRGEYWESVEIPILRKDGNIRIALWNSANIYAEDGQTLLASMAQGNDITERKQSEQEIERLYEDLQRRSVELEDANKELEAFSYSVSHDLRAPLRAIDGFSRILVEEHGSDLPPGAQRYLNLVRGNTSQMGKLVDDLLAFSRLSRQTLRSDRVNPVDLVHQCLEDLQTEREGRRLEIVVGDLSPCMADPSLLKQVWINLLSNALKFTRRREVARIEVGCLVTAAGSGQKATVYFVRDNGDGFDMQYAHKLFGVFQRLHRPEDYDGTGVGLAIVQRILHRHGGRVWAEAEPDKGATFYFTLGD